MLIQLGLIPFKATGDRFWMSPHAEAMIGRTMNQKLS
jgi:hypothetical protein